jgi:hypothetical protein
VAPVSRLGGCQRAVGTCQSLQSSGRSSFHLCDIAELMPMSAAVDESSGNSLPFTCNALDSTVRSK